MQQIIDNYEGSYYGDLSEINPKYKVHYFMLEEYIKKTISREKLKFIKEIEGMLYDFKKSMSFVLEKTTDDIREANRVIGLHKKFVDCVVTLNNLEKPKEAEIKPLTAKKKRYLKNKEQKEQKQPATEDLELDEMHDDF